MNLNNDEDILASLNRLFEMLHQAGGNNQGSTINLTLVAPGAQYVNHIDTQIFGADKSQKPKPASLSTNEPPQLPEPLATDEAMVLVFETFWHRQNMYQDYYDAVNQQQSFEVEDSLKSVFG